MDCIVMAMASNNITFSNLIMTCVYWKCGMQVNAKESTLCAEALEFLVFDTKWWALIIENFSWIHSHDNPSQECQPNMHICWLHQF